MMVRPKPPTPLINLLMNTSQKPYIEKELKDYYDIQLYTQLYFGS
jgi:hypothetical protein